MVPAVVAVAGCLSHDEAAVGQEPTDTQVDVASAPAQAQWTTGPVGLQYPVIAAGPSELFPIPHGLEASPQGAVVAAVVSQVLMSGAGDDVWPDVAQTLIEPGPGRDQWAQARALMSVDDSAVITEPPVFRVFQISDYSDARSVLDQLVEDGTVTQEDKDEATGPFILNHDKVQAIQQEHFERWDEISHHHADTRGFVGNALRAGQAGICWMGSPVNAALEVDSNSPFWNDPIGKLTKAALEGNTEALSMAIALWMDFSTTSGDVAANTQGVKNIVMGL